jgi:hypothetical protein
VITAERHIPVAYSELLTDKYFYVSAKDLQYILRLYLFFSLLPCIINKNKLRGFVRKRTDQNQSGRV